MVQKQRIGILIVEDDPDMAELIADLVEAEGWAPVVVHSAEEAAATLAQEDIHLVLWTTIFPASPAEPLPSASARN